MASFQSFVVPLRATRRHGAAAQSAIHREGTRKAAASEFRGETLPGDVCGTLRLDHQTLAVIRWRCPPGVSSNPGKSSKYLGKSAPGDPGALRSEEHTSE